MRPWKPKRVSERAAPTRLAAVLDRVPLIPPWTMEEFAHWLGEDKGKEVELSPWHTEAPKDGEPGACGLLWVTKTKLIVKYDARRSPRSQRQQICHEFGHLLCDHEGARWSIGESVLTDGIDPREIERIMHRSSFDTQAERDAEMLGTQIAVMSRGSARSGGLDRIASVFVERIRS